MEGISTQESVPSLKIEIESGYESFVPEEFIQDPIGYFEREGKNIKSGEKQIDENGVVREDPTAVKDLPTWRNREGQELLTVGRRVNTDKGKAAELGNPFHEFDILKFLQERGLPSAKPVLKVENGNDFLIVTERISGIRWSERDSLNLKNNGYSDEDISGLIKEAEQKMQELKVKFEKTGVKRGWKLKDMVFQLDIPKKKIASIIPTDWERTTITDIESKKF